MKELRLRRLFAADHRSVIIAFDHAGFMGPMQGLEDPGKLIDALASSGADAVLTTLGVARRFGDRLGKMGLILRVDGGSSMRSPVQGTLNNQFSIEDACRLGADAVICMGMIGYPEEPSSLHNLAMLSSQSEVWGIPLIAEMLVQGKDGQPATAKDVGFAMRIGVELGADLVKASYARPQEEFRTALQTCYRPVVVLGGEKTKNEEELLTSVSEALAAGASGVAIGRNVWQHSDPAGVCRALVALVHGNATVEQALKELKR